MRLTELPVYLSAGDSRGGLFDPQRRADPKAPRRWTARLGRSPVPAV